MREGRGRGRDEEDEDGEDEDDDAGEVSARMSEAEGSCDGPQSGSWTATMYDGTPTSWNKPAIDALDKARHSRF